MTLHLLFDGKCHVCRRTIAVLRVIDILGRIEYINAADRSELQLAGFGGMDEKPLLTDMHAVLGQKTWCGYDAYRAVARHVPVLWPAVPLLSFFPVVWLGSAVYRRAADSRHCRISGQVTSAVEPLRRAQGHGTRWVVGIGAALLLPNGIAGLKGINSWPIAVNPTFAPTPPSTASVVTMELPSPDGHVDTLVTGQDNPALSIGSERLIALAWEVALMDPGPRQQQALLALASVH